MTAPRWLHWCAVLTIVLALPLLLLGAEVTTHRFGLADPRGFRSPWAVANTFFEKRGLDWKVEHGHRFFGFLVGFAVIGLNVGLWWKETRIWVRLVGLLALAGVSVQGLLGIFRVEYHAPWGKEFALIHGCFAHLVLALLFVLATVTTKGWQRIREFSVPAITPSSVWRLAVLACVMVYAQLVFGAIVRHLDSGVASRAHVVLASGVAAVGALLAKSVWDARKHGNAPTAAVVVLLVLIGLQLFLGIEAWLSRFFVRTLIWNQLQPIPLHNDLIRSIHYLVGSLIFSTTVIIALKTRRNLGWQSQPAIAREAP